MKKVMFIMMVIAICIGAAARSNETVEKSRPVTEFDKVSFTAGVTVKFTQGSTHECTIIASPKDMEKIKVFLETVLLFLRRPQVRRLLQSEISPFGKIFFAN